MNYQKFNCRSFLNGLFSIIFVCALCLLSSPNAAAQRYLSEIKSGGEVKGISQFANDLSAFLELAEGIEQDATPVKLARLEAAGKKVKDGSSGFRRSLEALIAKIKKDNRWDAALDDEILGSLGNRKIKRFFQAQGGRKVLSEAINLIGSINADVDAIISNAKNPQAVNLSGDDGIFMKTSFAASASAKKSRFKCFLLGAAIFGAEIVKADRTAENLDGIFDKNCGAGAGAAV
jgi:hypothetical protein